LVKIKVFIKSMRIFFKENYIFILKRLVAFLLLLWILLIPLLGEKYNYKLGDIATGNIKAPISFSYIDNEATDFKKKEVERTIVPVFSFKNDFEANTVESFYKSIKKMRSDGANVTVSSTIIFNRYKIWLSSKSIFILLKKVNLEYFKKIISDLVNKMSNYWFINRSKKYFKKRQEFGIAVIKMSKKIFINPYELDNVIYEKLSPKFVRSFVRNSNPYLNSRIADMVVEVASKLVTPNTVFDQEKTLIMRKAILAKVAPIKKEVKKGLIIIREGERITEEISNKIKLVNANSKRIDLNHIVGLIFFLIAIYFFVRFHLRYFLKDLRLDSDRLGDELADMKFAKQREKRLLVLFSFVVIILFFAQMAIDLVRDSPSIPLTLFVPITIASISIMMLFGKRVAVFFTVVVSSFIMLLTGCNFVCFSTVLGGGLLSIYLSMHQKKRLDVLSAGVKVFLFYVFMLGLSSLMKGSSLDLLLNGVGIAFINGVMSSVIVAGILPFLESYLGIPTRFKLLELADTDSPLLKKLLLKAPGTFIHSITVGSLAESAAADINANSLLARVGAYYHDIGKLENPSYFIENQQGLDNIHDSLKPTVSRAVLVAHVKKGEVIAKREGLPECVIDFIREHHGTSLIKFFYAQAMGEEKNNTHKEDFRYPGPKPHTKETAIVMLADAVEASTKTIQNLTLPKIRAHVDNIIKAKINEGDLDNTPLLLDDIRKISESFVQMLVGLHHKRIEYPDYNKLEAEIDESKGSKEIADEE